jgi:TRAP-type mannitol/chloroaromatic compound transport system substrate-binding protein
MSTMNEFIISKAKWAELSDTQKEIIQTTCDATMLRQFAEGEAVQFKAMQEIQAKGVTFKYWDKAFLDTFRKAWEEVAAEQAAKSPEFAKGWKSYTEFRKNYAVWKQFGYLKD